MDTLEITLQVRAARGGDASAFEKVVLKYQRRILAYFLGAVGSMTQAEELAQETFVRAYLSLRKLKDPARFGPWLHGIAKNCHREWAKDRKKHAHPPPPEKAEATEIMKRKALLHRQIYNIVADLPDPYREVLYLKYFSGVACAGIADMLDRPVGTVTKQISRAHGLVADRLKGLQGYTTLLHFMIPKEDRGAG